VERRTRRRGRKRARKRLNLLPCQEAQRKRVVPKFSSRLVNSRRAALFRLRTFSNKITYLKCKRNHLIYIKNEYRVRLQRFIRGYLARKRQVSQCLVVIRKKGPSKKSKK
jgi:hypothetical protein